MKKADGIGIIGSRWTEDGILLVFKEGEEERMNSMPERPVPKVWWDQTLRMAGYSEEELTSAKNVIP